MCAVSAISDYYMNPPLLQYPFNPPIPALPPVKDMSPEILEMLRKVVEMLDKVDKKLGDKECMDETKKKFYEAISYKESI